MHGGKKEREVYAIGRHDRSLCTQKQPELSNACNYSGCVLMSVDHSVLQQPVPTIVVLVSRLRHASSVGKGCCMAQATQQYVARVPQCEDRML